MPNMPIMTSHKHRTANTPRRPYVTITTAYNITKMPSMQTNSLRSSMTIMSTHTTNQPLYMTANMTDMTTKLSRSMRSKGVVVGGGM